MPMPSHPCTDRNGTETTQASGLNCEESQRKGLLFIQESEPPGFHSGGETEAQ
jgi:hypothetical protein